MYSYRLALLLLLRNCLGKLHNEIEVVEVSHQGKTQLVRSEADVQPHIQPAALAETDDVLSVDMDDAHSKKTRADIVELARSAAAHQRTHSGHMSLAAMNTTPAGTAKHVDLGWTPCEWQRPTNDETMHCRDGTFCNPNTDQWTCCATHGGRQQCPVNFPKMCNQKDCGGNDYCCATWCERFDGERTCSIKHKVYGMDKGWLTMLTRDAGGDPIQEWTDLSSGPMTWELWYARRPQVPGSAEDQGNSIMSTYADNHNTNAYSTHNRRRNIGLYIQPKSGKLSLAAFVGDSVKAAPSAKDPFGGAHTMLGPSISDFNWHHIAVVWDRNHGAGYLYVDGQKHEDYVRYEPGDENPGMDGKLVIGGGHLGRVTTGQVSQVRLWKKALQQDHFFNIVQCGEPALPITDLKAFYRLSGDLGNSVTSGFLPLSAEQDQGVFAEGNPCEKGPPGFRGKDAKMGAQGPAGEKGPPGEKGEPSAEWGPPGPPGKNGTKGPPGKSVTATATEPNSGGATMIDFYICLGICTAVTLVAACAINWKINRAKRTEASLMENYES